jgi:hypothetical protein
MNPLRHAETCPCATCREHREQLAEARRVAHEAVALMEELADGQPAERLQHAYEWSRETLARCAWLRKQEALP